MQGANPLDQLRDIHLPAEIGWWPLAYGWWLVIGIAIAAIVGSGYAVLRYRAKRRYRAYATAELAVLRVQQLSDDAFLAQLSGLLKRTATSHFGKSCSALHGQIWIDFLSSHCDACDPKQLRTICVGQYQKNTNIDRQALADQVQLWLRRHK